MKIAQMTEKLWQWIQSVESSPMTLVGFVGIFLALIVLRITEQQLLMNALVVDSATEYFILFVNMSLAFVVIMLASAVWLSWILRVDILRILRILLVGMVIILLPPIVDIATFGRDYWDYYEFAGLRDLIGAIPTVFAQMPHLGVTQGMRVEIVLTTLATGIYALLHVQHKFSWSRVRRITVVLVTMIGVYAILFISGAIPSLIAIAVLGFEQGFWAVSQVDVAQMFLAPQQLLAREVTNPLWVLHMQMSIAYLLLISLFGTIWYRRQQHKFPTMRTFLTNNSAIGMFASGMVLLGIVSAILLDTTITVSSVLMSTFAVPAVVVVLGAAAVLALSLILVRADAVDNCANLRHLGWFGVGSALVAGAVVSGSVAILLLAIVALDIIRYRPPFALAQVSVISYVSAVLSGLLWWGVGVVLVSSGISMIFSLGIILFVASIVLGVMMAMEVARGHAIFVAHSVAWQNRISEATAQFVLAIGWSGIIFTSVVVFNVYNMIIPAALTSSAILFIALLRPQWLSFTIISTLTVYTALLLQWL